MGENRNRNRRPKANKKLNEPVHRKQQSNRNNKRRKFFRLKYRRGKRQK